ncbi:MAG: MFS transporter [Corallococcus sp.]|nr:MFS transporter [Corallococcus sp.]
MNEEHSVQTEKLNLGRKLAFASADIFGGGSFNIINFMFVPFLTLVVGIPMWYVSVILLFSKFWDGLIDPFIGKISDAKQQGKFGKRRYFMLICAPFVFIGLILLFFPWNLITDSIALKIVFVVVVYMMYATAQSFVLIPYYAHASELTDNYNERNKANAVRITFSLISSIICVVVPGMIASPTRQDGGRCYIVMAAVFGTVFAVSVLITALFSRERIVTPAITSRVSLREFFKPLKLKTYRQYLGMQMCTGMGMAVMSSFFFTYCDFYIRRNTYFAVMSEGVSRFPIATVSAALMFVAQIFALPFYLYLIKKKSKKFAYVTGAFIWIGVAVALFFLPAEGKIEIVNGTAKTLEGTPDYLIMILGFAIGFGVGGTMFVPHSSFGDVCDAGQLYFGERTEGAFSGLTNFLNTTAQAVGLSIPPLVIASAGYVETQYVSLEQYALYQADLQLAEKELGMTLDKFAVSIGANVQLQPMQQMPSAQLAIRLTIILLPIAICAVGIAIAWKYKLTRERQERIVAALKLDKDSQEYIKTRDEILSELGCAPLKTSGGGDEQK